MTLLISMFEVEQCCSICDSSVIYLINSVCIKSYFKLGKTGKVSVAKLKVAQGAQKTRWTQYFGWCANSGVTSAEDAKDLWQPSLSKTDDKWIEWRNIPKKKEKSLSLKLLTWWECNLGQLRAFWKIIWTHVRLPHACSLCSYLCELMKWLLLHTHPITRVNSVQLLSFRKSQDV
jgi:hypothetical protein